MTARFTDEEMREMGYRFVTIMSTGEIAALQPFMFTVGLVVGIDNIGYRCRWCYSSWPEAIAALKAWDGVGDPSGDWIKQKGRDQAGNVVDRRNPAHNQEDVI